MHPIPASHYKTIYRYTLYLWCYGLCNNAFSYSHCNALAKGRVPDLGLQTGYCDRHFIVVCSFKSMCGTKLVYDRFLPSSFQFVIYLIIFLSMIWGWWSVGRWDGRVCSAHKEFRNAHKMWLGSFEVKDHSEDIVEDRSMIFKWI
jgi:hypothetical protein